MCGIFAYIGEKQASDIIKNGLKRMEYRGYDSWGTALLNKDSKGDQDIKIFKNVGAIGEIELGDEISDANIGIGHTRWATHGGVTETNAHPHLSSDDSFALAQNGIVENFESLKSMLEKKGYKFESETDTEVIVRLVELKFSELVNSQTSGVNCLREASRLAFLDLEGRNTIVVLDKAGKGIIGIRNGSPLVVGIGEEGEYFFSSDALAFADITNRVYLMEDYEMVVFENGELSFFNAKTGGQIDKVETIIENYDSEISKEGFDNFMIKEIIEQKDTIRQSTSYSFEELTPFLNSVKQARTVYTVGAGTAAYAAAQIAFFLRKYALVSAVELRSYETNSYREIFSEKDLLIVVSQSGESADTIEAVEFAKAKGTKIASIVNMMGSTISRMSDFQFYSRTGPEICVASTKAFTAQISWGYLVAKSIVDKYDEAKSNISKLSEFLSSFLNEELYGKIKELVEMIKDKEHFFVLGKDQNFVIALEGALKVKEITYKHFEGFAAGELKHGVIALVDKGTPVFCVISNDEVKKDMISAAAEVNARGAMTIGIGDVEESSFFDFEVSFKVDQELSSIVNVIPFQLLSYFLGVALGNNIDKPRNLAKSVTVK
ncbi:glutamine--fructose-6-phosphate transaminase (isomerizing) [Candidatus Dojkabacteria bacterium]|nr:glutamine--fructose-6-phosphate transaminase (isomerizing) [Candidatus Dojkabacteria bacterium]